MEYNFAKLVLNKAKNNIVLRNGKLIVPMIKEELISSGLYKKMQN